MALNGWKERLFRRYLFWICRPSRVKKHLAGRIESRRALPPLDGRKVRAAALQLEARLFKNPLDYVDAMHRRAREAAAAGVHLAVFPEYNNLPLLGILPGVEQAGEAAEAAGGAENGGAKGPVISLEDVIHYVSPVLKPLVHATFSTLAEAYGLYLMAGSFLLSEDGTVRNRAFLYGPDGRLIGSQDKAHLMPAEEQFNVTRGDHFEAFETGLGKLALPVCMDASYFETFRILEKMGVEIALLPIANAEPYNYWLALRGIWPRLQESPLYGVKSALVGRVPGFYFTGRAGIFAPMELTPDGSGVLAEVASSEAEGMAVAELDLDALQALRQNHPWRDRNRALYARYFPAIYEQIPG